MFEFKKELATPSVNLLSTGTEIRGNTDIIGDFRVDGLIIGNIKCSGKLIIGTTAYVEGKIECENCDISGTVIGSIKTTNLTIFKDTSNFHGHIITTKIQVDNGSILNMNCEMDKKPEIIC